VIRAGPHIDFTQSLAEIGFAEFALTNQVEFSAEFRGGFPQTP
jgi:hypothetical protein